MSNLVRDRHFPSLARRPEDQFEIFLQFLERVHDLEVHLGERSFQIGTTLAVIRNGGGPLDRSSDGQGLGPYHRQLHIVVFAFPVLRVQVAHDLLPVAAETDDADAGFQVPRLQLVPGLPYVRRASIDFLDGAGIEPSRDISLGAAFLRRRLLVCDFPFGCRWWGFARASVDGWSVLISFVEIASIKI